MVENKTVQLRKEIFLSLSQFIAQTPKSTFEKHKPQYLNWI